MMLNTGVTGALNTSRGRLKLIHSDWLCSVNTHVVECIQTARKDHLLNGHLIGIGSVVL